MRTEKEIIELAYAYWMVVVSPACPPAALLGGMPAVLHTLLWVLGKEDEDTKLLTNQLTIAQKVIEDDCIADPIGVITRDLESRKQAQKQARASENN